MTKEKTSIGALNDDSRAKRRPIRETLEKMHAAGGRPREGFVRRWIKEKRTSSMYGTRTKELEALGYTFVKDEDLGIDGMVAGKFGSLTHKVERNGDELYLMEIPTDIYKEIQAIKLEKVITPSPLSGEGFATDAKLTTKKTTNPNG